MEDEISRMELFEIWRSESNNSKKVELICDYIMSKHGLEDPDENISAEVRKKTIELCKKFKERWSKCHYVLKYFLTKYSEWLSVKITFIETVGTQDSHENRDFDRKTIGRPQKLFEDSSDKSRKRKVKPLLEQNAIDEIVLAAEMGLRSTGRRDAAQLVKEVSSHSPKRATKIKKAFRTPSPKMPIKMTSDEALAFFIDTKLTKDQYISMRQISKTHNADIFPNYHMLLEAKKQCYPENIHITEYSGEICLQSLVQHTINRLVTVQMEVLKQLRVGIDTLPTLNIVFKWGCDGASGQSQYKQLFSTTEEDVDDSYIFVISLVPLQMTTNSAVSSSTSKGKKIIVWQNPLPASTKYCRPIKLILKKESPELTKTEVNNIKSQIEVLTPTMILAEGREITVKPELVLSMIDGKICSVLSNQATQNCHICGATPSQMNNLSLVTKRTINEMALSLGLSSLHAWIKVFECLLHISYRLNIQSWQIRKEHKAQVEERKKIIQDRFRNEMGLLVDIPKPGFGSTNDGNTARRFFADPALSSDITGVDQELILRFGTILKTIASGYGINTEALEQYCYETAKLYVQKYNWFYMPQSVHKILIHSTQLVKEAVLPVGMMSEEAQEARNKDYKNFREHHSRKFSRTETMTDLMHMLLISSDPVVSSLRVKRQKRSKSISPDVLRLLQDPGYDEDDDIDDNSYEN